MLREASLNRNAAALLVGIPDENYDQFSKLNEIITVAGGLISASLRSLLESTDPDVMSFTYGRDLFLKMLKNSNLLDSTPLEAAYIWVLATKSALKNTLRFLETSFEIKCDLVKTGRLFPGEDSGVIDTSSLRKNVIYHALERVDGMSTHPLADMFFISDRSQLVLVDIAGGNEQSVQKKKKNLLKWIEKKGGCVDGYTLHGVVLAPLMSTSHQAIHGFRITAIVPWRW